MDLCGCFELALLRPTPSKLRVSVKVSVLLFYLLLHFKPPVHSFWHWSLQTLMLVVEAASGGASDCG